MYPTSGATSPATEVGPDVFRQQLWIPAGTVSAGGGSASTAIHCGRLRLGGGLGSGEMFRSSQPRQTHGADRQTGTGQAAVEAHPGNIERRGDGERAGDTERGGDAARRPAFAVAK